MIDVHHLGRAGEVAGGMTQVVNDYLVWPFPRTRHSVIRTRQGGGLKDLPLAIAAARRISALKTDERPVVVAHLSQRGSFIREGGLAVLAARRGLPVIAQIHGSSFPEFATRHPRLVRWVLARVRAVHVLSSESAEAIRSVGVSAPVVVIPNAVAAIEPRAKTRSVVFGGAVTRRKGVDTLLEAWRATTASDGWTLLIAGPHIEPELVQHLPSGVRAPGSLTRAELHEALATAAIAALPSRDEAMPLFILEAMAAGAAVIATPVGGIADVVDERLGILVPIDDAPALAGALDRLMGNPDAVVALGTAARALHSETYSATAVIARLEDLWLGSRDADS